MSSMVLNENPQQQLIDNPKVLLKVFQQPVMMNPIYTDITKDTLAALLLSFAIHAHEQYQLALRERKLLKNPEYSEEEVAGWVPIRDQEWIEHTHMQAKEIKYAKKILADLDLMLSRKIRGTTWYLIKMDEIQKRIMQYNAETDTEF